jgi:hypothetical protein
MSVNIYVDDVGEKRNIYIYTHTHKHKYIITQILVHITDRQTFM